MQPSSDDLEAMIIHMRSETAQDADPVRNRVTALITAIHDTVLVRGTVPSIVVSPPVVVLDSLRFDTFCQDQLTFWVQGNTAAGIYELVIRCGAAGFGIEELGTHVARIESVFSPGPGAPQDVVLMDFENAIVRQLTVCQPSQVILCGLVGDQALGLPLPQAAAIITFHQTYPRVWRQLADANVTLLFNSTAADEWGGGYFQDKKIHMSKLPFMPAGAFVRLVVHEIGHALFEQILLNHKTMPIQLMRDQIAGFLEPGAQDASERTMLCQLYWDEMSGLAKIFYRSWLTLCQHRGLHMLGVDLWEGPEPRRSRLAPQQRRSYQAGGFDEFCAESFMLYAMGDLQPHVQAVLADATIDQDVRTAWQNAWYVLETVAGPILGPRR
jgi:hypothetical protein